MHYFLKLRNYRESIPLNVLNYFNVGYYSVKVIEFGLPDNIVLINLIFSNYYSMRNDIPSHVLGFSESAMVKIFCFYNYVFSNIGNDFTYQQLVYLYLYSILSVTDQLKLVDYVSIYVDSVRSFDKSILFNYQSNIFEVNEALGKISNSTNFVLNNKGNPGFENLKGFLDAVHKEHSVDISKPINSNIPKAVLFTTIGFLGLVFNYICCGGATSITV